MSLERRTHHHSLSDTFPHLCFICTKCHIKQALKKQAIFKATCELKSKLTPNTKNNYCQLLNRKDKDEKKTKQKKHLHATNNTEVNKRCLSGFCHSVRTQTPDTQSWWRSRYSNTSRKKSTKTSDLHSVCISGIPHAQSHGLKTFLLFPHSVHNSHFLLKNHLGFHILEAGTDLPIICFSKLKLLNILLPKTNRGEQLHLQKKPKE